jgi:hypothetical protein
MVHAALEVLELFDGNTACRCKSSLIWRINVELASSMKQGQLMPSGKVKHFRSIEEIDSELEKLKIQHASLQEEM